MIIQDHLSDDNECAFFPFPCNLHSLPSGEHHFTLICSHSSHCYTFTLSHSSRSHAIFTVYLQVEIIYTFTLSRTSQFHSFTCHTFTLSHSSSNFDSFGWNELVFHLYWLNAGLRWSTPTPLARSTSDAPSSTWLIWPAGAVSVISLLSISSILLSITTIITVTISERHGKTGISTNEGHAFSESKSINLSLSCLGKVDKMTKLCLDGNYESMMNQSQLNVLF